MYREEIISEAVARVTLPGRSKMDLCHRCHTAAITAAVVGALAATAGAAVAIKAAVTPNPKQQLPTTARARVADIQSKLIPAMEKKIAAERSKATPDQSKISQWTLEVQDLNDEKLILTKNLEAQHKEAIGDVSSKDSAVDPAQSKPAATEKLKVSPTVVAVSVASVIATGFIVMATRKGRR